MTTATKLRQFRKQCERQTGATPGQIQVTLLDALIDVCAALSLSKRDTRKVLGRKATIELSTLRDMRVELVERPDSRQIGGGSV